MDHDELQSFEYDIALSFAGEDQNYVSRMAEILRSLNVHVCYDEFQSVDMWGKDLYVYLDEIYRKKACYCILFLSRHYATKAWTNHERKSAQARAFFRAIKNTFCLLVLTARRYPGYYLPWHMSISPN